MNTGQYNTKQMLGLLLATLEKIHVILDYDPKVPLTLFILFTSTFFNVTRVGGFR